MAEVSDEILMAYADGELDAAACSELEALLPSRPDLVARIEKFKRTRVGVRRPFHSIFDEQVPAQLIASIRSAPIGGSNVEPFRRPSASRPSNSRSSLPPAWKYTAIAASIGLLVGCASGWYAGASTKPSSAAGSLVADAGIRALGAMRTALETASSGVVADVELGDGQQSRIMAVATFRSKDDRYCRQYEISSKTRYEGVACRNASGAWDIVYHGKVAAKRAPNGLIPAGSNTAIDEIIEGGVFEAAEEQKAIKNGWKLQR